MSVRTVQLGEVATIERRAATEAECVNLPFVGLEHVESGSGNFAGEFKRRPEPMLATKFRFGAEHVLYGKLRPYLNKVVLPNFDGVCTTEILPILAKPGVIDRRFLYAMLLSPYFVRWASLRVSGANLPRLDPGMLEEFCFDLPSLPEQERIAGLLERTDRLRRSQRYALDLSDAFIPAAFLELFGDVRQQDHRWACVELETHSEIVSGVAKGQRYGDRETIEVPYLRVANVQDGYLDLSVMKTIRALPTDVESLRLKAGDIVMTEGGDFDKLGRGAIWPGGIANCIHQNHIFRVRLDCAKLLPTFFAAFLRSAAAKNYFLRCSKQTTNLASINMTQLRATPVPLPPLAIQRHFAAMVARHERLRAIQREALRQADHLFQTLLQKTFSPSE